MNKIIIIILVCFISCQSEQKSKVIYFNYDGYGDYIYSTLYGTVLEIDSIQPTMQNYETLKPLKDATIISYNSENIIYKKTKSDSLGNFYMEFEFPKEAYSFKVIKDSFQEIKIENYQPIGDMVAKTIIGLKKGKGKTNHKLDDRPI